MWKLKSFYQDEKIEVGLDEAGRGCLAGPVFAAAVILPKDYKSSMLNDSKQLTEKKRLLLREEIEEVALDFAVAQVSPGEIDKINIHNASYLAMHRAMDMLASVIEFIIVDGNRFIPYRDLPFECIVKGDAKYYSIAAASILAKTYRDEYMYKISQDFPCYDWHKNKGYPTADHRKAILSHGVSEHHRKSFKVTDPQLKLFNKPLKAQ
ncbi:MAG TPA: ribonuclease HII [Candidatus Sphingobacterium stercoripullorum]|uniref:Ribonuclease HII n=1 Tax=Candidatus Sphingobacterium stercoripullorum TaxID=2838759 RepID=A0A9D1W7E4_9SPHI|nr:ribonuclease HII [Candidatus Sphingobacterium stercoripullorum]HLR50312.1 ribonuclease HII [Candidatus Sphingobacterium stercoripullorum]